jgi:NADPH2:quinone reductase
VYQWLPALPFSPGNQLAGEIEQLGEGVSGVQVSQRVLVSARDLPQRGGCYAEYVTVPADRVYPLPETVPYEDAVCLANYEVAWAILADMVGPRSPQTALIVGAAGGVGSALVQLAKRAGVMTIALVSSHAKASFALAMGADHVVDRDSDCLREQVFELTAGAGVDLIVDHAAGPAFTKYIGMLANWGTLVSYGALAGNPTDDLFAALRDNIGRSPSVRCFSIHSYDRDNAARRRTVSQLIDSLAKHEIRPAIARSYPLSKVRDAHKLLEEGAACGRIVMYPDPVSSRCSSS